MVVLYQDLSAFVPSSHSYIFMVQCLERKCIDAVVLHIS